MLVSYNVCNDSAQQDCLYIEQGHLMTSTMFMTYSMVIDPQKSVVVSWTPIRMSSTLQQGSLALISTGITFIYFFLKACHYVFDAISHQTEGRVATATSGCGQQEHSADTGKEGHTEVCKQIQGNLSEQYGRGTQNPQGPFFYQEGGKTYASLPMGMLQNIQRAHFSRKCKRIAKQKALNSRKT